VSSIIGTTLTGRIEMFGRVGNCQPVPPVDRQLLAV